ncbi:nucleoside deaminase [Desulfonatronum thiodismutans]|uniref:nucleoside deaminase n=1 Tax=Desulfonatronum thiodismutans TaxID=159290 RepID=UPI000691A67B|nr:nucleoside deaminase [Desulfonatronum thiodismutans]
MIKNGKNPWQDPMRLALGEALTARDHGEVPVGAVVLDRSGTLLSAAHNKTLTAQDPAGHAEMLALREAAIMVGNHRLTGCVLVVTLEPCLMCLGALIQARVAGLVFGARDPKAGAVLSRININDLDWLNHRFWVIEGVLAQECTDLLGSFFAGRRKNSLAASTQSKPPNDESTAF